jgi:hypothetical protein
VTKKKRSWQKQKTLDRMVGTVWALCRRPGLYTATSTLEEVVAYMFGLLHEAPPEGRQDWPNHERKFGQFLCRRHGATGEKLWCDARIVVSVLRRAYPDSDAIGSLWNEFEDYANEHLGVAKGTYPVGVSGCGYGSNEAQADRSQE